MGRPEVRVLDKPAQKEVLKINTFMDAGYREAMRHAGELLEESEAWKKDYSN